MRFISMSVSWLFHYHLLPITRSPMIFVFSILRTDLLQRLYELVSLIAYHLPTTTTTTTTTTNIYRFILQFEERNKIINQKILNMNSFSKILVANGFLALAPVMLFGCAGKSTRKLNMALWWMMWSSNSKQLIMKLIYHIIVVNKLCQVKSKRATWTATLALAVALLPMIKLMPMRLLLPTRLPLPTGLPLKTRLPLPRCLERQRLHQFHYRVTVTFAGHVRPPMGYSNQILLRVASNTLW